MARPSSTGGKTSKAKARHAGPAKGRKTTKTKPRIPPAAARAKRRPVSGPSKDLKEAREQLAATAEILKVIASSPSDVQPVFDAIVANAGRLIGGFSAGVYRFVDGICHLGAITSVNPADELLRARFPRPIAGITHFELAQTGKTVEIADTETDADLPLKELARVRSFRSVLYVPLMSQGVAIGVISVTRTEPGRFSDHHVQLLQSFADQAVIAIENTRLFDEVQARTNDLTEALQQQTATADVLKVISRSAFDLQNILDTLIESAALLCTAERATLVHQQGQTYVRAALHGFSKEAGAEMKYSAVDLNSGTIASRALRQCAVVHVADVSTDPDYPKTAALVLGGVRTVLSVPLVRDGRPIGAITLSRTRVDPFTPTQIDLIRTFADQAVIAIENVRLFDEVQAKTRDLSELLQQQTATADVLKVISRSAFDLETVMNTLASSAAELCGASISALYHREGDLLVARGIFTIDEKQAAFLRSNHLQLSEETFTGHAVVTGTIANIADTEGETKGKIREFARALGYRAVLILPLIREGQGVGAFALARNQAGAFTQRQIELVQTFADQAVIAIGNVRLFDEVQAKTRDLSEALTYQTGSANILKVIASSPTDVGPVLKAIVETACELCEAYDAVLVLKDGQDLRFSAHHGPIPMTLVKWPINRNWTAGRAFVDQEPVHVHDLQSFEGDEFPEGRAMSLSMGHRTILSVPLLSEAGSIGTIVLRRKEVHPFTEKQIALLQTFADQAVIAIGNVRLFDEVQAKTRDLSEALTYQTGSANILSVIASSPTDVEPVLKAIVESACELCDAVDAIVLLKDGDKLRHGAHHGSISVVLEQWPINRNWVAGRSFLDHKPVQVHDIDSAEGDEFVDTRQFGHRTGARCFLSVPLLREGESIGTIVLRRVEPDPFSDKQIALLQTFADQAVIAIENTRLFNETKEALEQQTATAEVLEVISSSPGELDPVFQKMLENACRVCEANFGVMHLLEGDSVVVAADYNLPIAYRNSREGLQVYPHPESGLATVIRTHEISHMTDLREGRAYRAGAPHALKLADVAGARTVLVVPMLKGAELIGTITIFRQEVRPFTDKQIALVENFTKQAVIAIENTRLLKELRMRTQELSQSLDDLRAAQDRLVQTEKLASLGQLTAGIAHEIKNPLNFVNNFSALSAELTDELNDVLKPVAMDGKVRGEVDELTGLLKDNLEKVVQHGKRADSIVKNMLLHSREGSREHRLADINSLLDESLNLAYHGARAEKGEFNINLQRDFDADAGTIELFPQEITRAFLNLIANGVYAATRRKNENKEPDFEPTLWATTKNLGTTVEIRIRDNGTGIPAEVQDKMFNPFFTTKPAGEGTGLGLSMTHDIIVKQHGGRIDVATEPGQFTEFIIVLPRMTATGNTGADK